jgi:hypothetical protein
MRLCSVMSRMLQISPSPDPRPGPPAARRTTPRQDAPALRQALALGQLDRRAARSFSCARSFRTAPAGVRDAGLRPLVLGVAEQPLGGALRYVIRPERSLMISASLDCCATSASCSSAPALLDACAVRLSAADRVELFGDGT